MILGTAIADVGIIDIIKTAVDVGITPVLLIAFVWYFFQRDKNRDKITQQEKENSQKQIDAANRQSKQQVDIVNKLAKDREDMLLLNNAKREEMIRSEAEKREKIIRQESEKRENALIFNMAEQTKSIEIGRASCRERV